MGKFLVSLMLFMGSVCFAGGVVPQAKQKIIRKASSRLTDKSAKKIAVKVPINKKLIKRESALSLEDIKYLKNSYYYKAAKEAFKFFQKESFSVESTDFDVMFMKMEKKVIYQYIDNKDVDKFQFTSLTNEVVKYIQTIKSTYGFATLTAPERSLLQLNFYGLSQAIRKANEMNLTIQAEHFDKLHDLMIGQSTVLFYSSYDQYRYADFFWTSYFLHTLNYPMDLTVKHLKALGGKINTFKNPARYHVYGEKIARHSLFSAQKLNKMNTEDLEVLYSWAKGNEQDTATLQLVQKSYLKQLQLVGDSEKVKEVKKELAFNLLIYETKLLLQKPWMILKYVQFVIGYVLLAWPLEVILLVVAGFIFIVQSSSVLSKEEEKRANKLYKKMWMMFTKSYLGRDVPFFSKLAASLILFGVGLYFNSAKNFVESLISSL